MLSELLRQTIIEFENKSQMEWMGWQYLIMHTSNVHCTLCVCVTHTQNESTHTGQVRQHIFSLSYGIGRLGIIYGNQNTFDLHEAMLLALFVILSRQASAVLTHLGRVCNRSKLLGTPTWLSADSQSHKLIIRNVLQSLL